MGDRLKTKETETKTVERDDLTQLLTRPIGGDIRPVVPQTFDEVFQMADAIIEADMVPLGLKGKTPKETRSKVGICIQKGLEVGFAPVTSLSRISVINGRPCIDCEGAMAKALESGRLEWFKERTDGEKDERTAICVMKRKGVTEPIHRQFSVNDAKRAHLWMNNKKDPWMKYPQRMLTIRARAWAVRDLFSDVLAGLHIMEEQRDIPAAPCAPDLSVLDDEPAPEATEGTMEEPCTPEPSSEPDEPAEIHPYIQNMMDGLARCQTKEDVGTFHAESEDSREMFLADNPDQKDLLLNLFSDREKELR